MTDHAGKGPWIWKNGYEYVMTLGVVAVAVTMAGPGTVSVDRLIGSTSSGTGWGLAAATLGLVSGLAVLELRRRTDRAANDTAGGGHRRIVSWPSG